MHAHAFFKVCLVLICLNTIVDKTYPETWIYSFLSISCSKADPLSRASGLEKLTSYYPRCSCSFLCQSLAQRLFLILINFDTMLFAPCCYDPRWLSMLLSSIPLSTPRSSSFSIAAFDRSIKLIFIRPSPVIALPCQSLSQFLLLLRLDWCDAGVLRFMPPFLALGKASMKEKNVFFRALQNEGAGGLPMPKFFGPFSRSAFLVNKKSLFLQKCQCIELLTVF